MPSDDDIPNTKVVCGICGADVLGPSDAEADDVFACADAGCGNRDTYSNVMSEAQSFSDDEVRRRLQKSLTKSERKGGYISISVDTTAIPDRDYRFKTVWI